VREQRRVKVASTDYVIHKAAPLSGRIAIPGDKSISHRALLIAAIAEGATEISGFLPGQDCFATLSALQSLNVSIELLTAERVIVHGGGLHGLRAVLGPIYLGNSGTSMRLLAGLLAGQPFISTLTGDASLSNRPMQRIITPLQQMGATVLSTAHHTAPLVISGTAQLKAISYTLPVASAQIKSCILLAGIYAHGTTELFEPGVSRDHTERLLQHFNYPIEILDNHIRLPGQKKLHAKAITVPGDISSAAFLLVAALLVKDSMVELLNVGINPTRLGVIELLREMGAKIEFFNQRFYGLEPVADLRIVYSPLHGVDVSSQLAPRMIDEFPILFIAAAAANGVTRIRGVGELRVKESDRLQTMADGLKVLGVRFQLYPDGMDIYGLGENNTNNALFMGGQVKSHGDHRIAMAFCVAGLLAKTPLTIKDCAMIQTSFPNFIDCAKKLGWIINIEH